MKNNWLKMKMVGTKANRSGIGERVYCTKADLVIHWTSGIVDKVAGGERIES